MNKRSTLTRLKFSLPASLLRWLLLFICLCSGSLIGVKADDLLGDDKGIGTILDDMREESSTAWWNDDWNFRRRVTINDLALLGSPDTAILLSEPEPLLLYNTGRCAEKLTDLRVVSADGQLLPCGVTHFGRDDGSSKIWFVPNLREGQTKLEVALYYGNPKAEATHIGAEVPEGRDGDPQFMRIGAEEVRPGATAPQAIPGSFFHNLLVAEAESFTPTNAPAPSYVKSVDAAGASGEKFLTLQDSAPDGKPVSVLHTIQVPEAGIWYVHVRYKNPERKQKYESFKLSLGAKEFDCGTKRDEGAPFSWQSMQAELPKGALQLGLHFRGMAAPDAVLLTRDGHYRPDYRDINGPVWMRFKVTSPAAPPFYVDLFGTYITTSVNGPQGKTTAYLFRDRAVLPKRSQYGTDNGGTILTSELPASFKKLPNDPASLLGSGDWSPWGETLGHGSYTWYSQVRFIAGGKAIGTTPGNLKVASEFATRPDVSRIFHTSTASTGTRNTFNIHMPPALDLETVCNHTVTFDEWARQRLELAKSLGFKGGEGPKQIVACTIAGAQSAAEAESILTTLDWIGLNTVTLQGNGFDQEAVLRHSSIKSFWTYYRTEYKVFNRFYTVDPGEMIVSPTGVKEPKLNPRGRMPGLTNAQTVEKIVATATDKYYRDSAMAAKKAMPWEFSHIRYNDLDDEIGPAVDGRSINSHPLFKGFFIEYLKARNLQPGFFGVKTWDDLEAIDYSDIGKKQKRLEQLNKDAEAAQKKLEEASEAEMDANGNVLHGLDDPIEENDKEQKEKARREKEGLPVEDRPAPTNFEKRAYYWTQKFRSHYTALFYHYETAAVHKYFPAGIRTCANMQASPIQAGRMWDGGLNIWDLGRQNAFSALQVEDWHTSPVNVSFGMNMARAAGRKNGQPATALIVLGRPAQRIIVDLAQGARYLLFYLYGPVQGDPAFAEDRETLLQIGRTMRKIRRAEPDILAAKNRPCDTAILVDNASEINGQYFSYPFDHDRMAVYAALNDQQVPVDLVGAEEVLDDNALSRYKVLYVCDPHVQTRVQQKIKAWVAAGGTLWADYAALARDEYDEPSKLMDEVFGLKTRGPVVPYTVKGYNGKLPLGVTIKIQKGNLLAADTITDIRYSAVADTKSSKPDYKLSTGKALATFSDGKPAIIRNKYGKGQAMLNGFLAGISYGGQWEPHGYNFSRIAREAPATRTRAQLMTAIARAADARPHVKINEHMFWANVHDGPHQTVVYMVNGSRALKAMPLEVTLPKVPKSAYRGNGQAVGFKVIGSRAILPLTLAANDCDILVFKY